MSTKTSYQKQQNDKGSFSESPNTRNRTFKAVQDNFSLESQFVSEGSPSNSTPIQRPVRPSRQSRFRSQPSLFKLEGTNDQNRSSSKSNSPDSKDAEGDLILHRRKTKAISSLEDIDTSSYYQSQSTLMHLDSFTDVPGHVGYKRNLSRLSSNLTVSVQSFSTSHILDLRAEDSISPLKKQPNFEPKYFWRFPSTKIGGLQGTEPESRESSTLVTLGRDLYLFGGKKKDNYLEDLWRYKPNKNAWKKVICENASQIKARSGHSAIALKGCMYVFGGEVQYHAEPHSYTKVVNDLLIYHPNVMRWTTHSKSTETVIPARKHHAVAIYEQVMLIHGGIGSVGNYLNDIWVFNTELECWRKLPVKRTEFERGGLAFHTMCAVFGDKGYLGDDSRKQFKPQLEGFYVFGGKTEKGDSVNTLQVLTYNHDKKGISWVYPHIKGAPPSPRYQHTMVHFPEANCLIMYGGRSTPFAKSSAKYNLDDLVVLNLEYMAWVSPKMSGDTSIKTRYAHSSTIHSGKMLVFGGKFSEDYIESGLSILELKANDVEKLQSMSSPNKQPTQKEPSTNSVTLNKVLSHVLMEGQVETPSYYHRRLPQTKSPKRRQRNLEHLPSIFNSGARHSKWGLSSKNSLNSSITETSPPPKPHQTVLNFFKNTYSASVTSICNDSLE